SEQAGSPDLGSGGYDDGQGGLEDDPGHCEHCRRRPVEGGLGPYVGRVLGYSAPRARVCRRRGGHERGKREVV
ncbi:unnamed protein product, partial [Prorocentrum cordatum]